MTATISTRDLQPRYESGLNRYGVPPHLRGLTLTGTPWVAHPRVKMWFVLWSKGHILNPAHQSSATNMVFVGDPQQTSEVAAGLVQDALRLSAEVDVPSHSALRWVSGVGLMHEMLRKPDADYGTEALTYARLTASTLLVLPEVDSHQRYEIGTVERVLKMRSQKSVPTILTMTPESYRDLEATPVGHWVGATSLSVEV